MNILVHGSERRYIDANHTVWTKLKEKGHNVTLWLHLHNIPANNGVVKEYHEKGFSVIDGKCLEKYDGKDGSYLISKLKPNVIIPVEGSIYSWVKIHKSFKKNFPKLPIIGIQNSFGGKPEDEYEKNRKKSGWYEDWQLVWGRQQKVRNSTAGFPEERIIVTGNPNWDKYHHQEITDDGSILFIAGTTFNYLKETGLQKVWNKYHKSSFIFKNHPNHMRFFESTCPIQGNKRVKILYSYPIHKLIKRAKVIVSSTSTCGIEAMLIGKPTMIMDVGQHTDKFKNSGRLIKPKDFQEELRRCMNKEEDRSKVPDFLDSVSFNEDGKATERVIQAICQIGKGILK
jgi:hypothetical protein